MKENEILKHESTQEAEHEVTWFQGPFNEC